MSPQTIYPVSEHARHLIISFSLHTDAARKSLLLQMRTWKFRGAWRDVVTLPCPITIIGHFWVGFGTGIVVSKACIWDPDFS
jgi:hypothetical protein